jgi:hypothetical protein
MKRTLYLRAETEADLKAALPWAVLDDDEVIGGETIREAGDWKGHERHAEQAGVPGLWSMDYIRRIETSPAVYGDPVYDPETGEPNITTPAEYDTRFHANLILIGAYDPPVPESVIIPAPENPVRQRM